MGLLTPRGKRRSSSIRERATRALARTSSRAPGIRLSIALGLVVGLLPALGLLALGGGAGAPAGEPTRAVSQPSATPSTTRRAPPRPTPTPWPLDLWTRLVVVPTPEIGPDDLDGISPIDPLGSLATSTPASPVRPAATATPEPDIVSTEEISRIQSAVQATVTAEAARVTPVTSGAIGRLGAAVPDQVRRWESLIIAACDRYKVDPNLVAALMMTESGGYERALSSKGAVGLMQIIDGPWDPADNIRLGTAILADNLRRYGGRVDLALAGYNAGNGAVAKYGGIPPFRETRDHVFRVLLRYDLYRAA